MNLYTNLIPLNPAIYCFPPTVVWRHRKENLKKCSLRGLEPRADFRFFTYPVDTLPDLEGYILLEVNAPPLTPADRNCGLLLVDATWRYAELMLRQLQHKTPYLISRSLPAHFQTTYPRRQTACPNPETGLASVEALYAAYVILGRDPSGLLDHYHWGSAFLAKNIL